MTCAAIIVAGGSGKRFGGGQPKQFRPLAGVPMLARTLRAFEGAKQIDVIVLVIPANQRAQVTELLQAYPIKKPLTLCGGGAERYDSVQAGINGCPEQTTFVAIHDGARPLISPDLIDAVVEQAREHGAALLALPARDTVKRAANDGCVAQTLDRSEIYLAQTPQVFDLALLRNAVTQWEQQGRPAVTDDAQLMEQFGDRAVRLVEGSTLNLKITVPADLAVAEALLATGQETQS